MGVGFSRFQLFQRNNNKPTLTASTHPHQHPQRKPFWWQNVFNFNHRNMKTNQPKQTTRNQNDEVTAQNTKANRSKMSAKRCLALCDIAVRLSAAGHRRRNAIIHALHLSPRAVANIHRFNPENAFLNPSTPVETQPRSLPSANGTRRRKQVTFAPLAEMRFFRK